MEERRRFDEEVERRAAERARLMFASSMGSSSSSRGWTDEENDHNRRFNDAVKTYDAMKEDIRRRADDSASKSRLIEESNKIAVRARQISAGAPTPFVYSRDRADSNVTTSTAPIATMEPASWKGGHRGGIATFNDYPSQLHQQQKQQFQQQNKQEELLQQLQHQQQRQQQFQQQQQERQQQAWAESSSVVPNFSIFEVNAPAGPLGLVLFPFTMQIMIMSKVVSIYGCIVKESTLTTAIRAGDIVMSVGNATLLADEQQSPGGQLHVNACVSLLKQAANPRSIRFYRSPSINANASSCMLSAEEALQVSPIIFSSGDGSQQLMETINQMRKTGAASQSSVPLSMEEEVANRLNAARRAAEATGAVFVQSSGSGKPSFNDMQNNSSDLLNQQRQGLPEKLPESFNSAFLGGLDAAANRPVYKQRTLVDEQNRLQHRSIPTEGEHVARVFEYIFREKKSTLGLDLAPVNLSLEVQPGQLQHFWAAMVLRNLTGDNK